MEIDIDYGALLLSLFVIGLYVLFISAIIGILWNMTLSNLFALPKIDYSDAIVIYVFARALLSFPSITAENAE